MPLQQAPTDWYAILGVEANATPGELRAAWRKQCKRFDPGRYPTETQQSTAFRRLNKVNEAYSILGDPGSRNDFDRQRAKKGPVLWSPIDAAPVKPAAPRTSQFHHDPNRKTIVFDGVTYLTLKESARRLGWTADRLELLLDMGEIHAIEFEGEKWLTEASLIPLRTRNKSKSVTPAKSFFGAPMFKAHKPRPHEAPDITPRRRIKSKRAGSTRSSSMGRQFDAPYLDHRARPVLDVAPTLFLVLLAILMYGMLANAPSTISGLNHYGQQVIETFTNLA